MTLQNPRRQKELGRLISILGLESSLKLDWHLLDLALTHSTFSKDNYEELEFVGDAVLRLAAAEFLLDQRPRMSAGEMTAIRSILVSDRNLAKIADAYNLQRYLLADNSALSDPQGQEARLAASFEAVLAALYLSTHDLTLIRPWLDSHLKTLMDEIRSDPALQNYKGALQELTNARYKTLPEYRVTELSQVDGDIERFEAEVWLQEQRLGVGRGPSKKTAEQAAAQVAFLTLRQGDDSATPSKPPA
jgi:ribonuclease-3